MMQTLDPLKRGSARFPEAIRWTVLFLLSVGGKPFVHAANPVFDIPTRQVRAEVEILAISTLVRDSSGNQDVYLAMVRMKGQQPTLAKLIDDYPTYNKPIRAEVLRNHTALSMMLVRLAGRDAPARDFFLSADSQNIFDSGVRSVVLAHQSETIPAFTVEHTQTRLAHSADALH